MANIRIQKQKMLDLRDMGHIAQQADMKVTIDAAGGGKPSLILATGQH